MPWIQLLLMIEPSIPAIVADIKAMLTKHPALADPAAQQAFVVGLMQAALSVDDAGLAAIAADKGHAQAAGSQSSQA